MRLWLAVPVMGRPQADPHSRRARADGQHGRRKQVVTVTETVSRMRAAGERYRTDPDFRRRVDHAAYAIQGRRDVAIAKAAAALLEAEEK